MLDCVYMRKSEIGIEKERIWGYVSGRNCYAFFELFVVTVLG